MGKQVTEGKSAFISLRDIASGKLPDGTFDQSIVDMISETNPSLMDILWRVCNKGKEHIGTIRTGMPKRVWEVYYKGIPSSASSKKQVINACGTITSKASWDRRLLDAEKAKGYADQFIADEVAAHGQTLGEGVAEALFYGNIADTPEGINGLAKTYAAYGSITSARDVSASYVINGKGTDTSVAALRSIFLVGWGQNSIHGLYPEGTSVGLNRGSIMDVPLADADGNTYPGQEQILSYGVGLNIADFRYGGRLCNLQIDKAFDTGAPDHWDLVMSLIARVKSGGGVNQRFYMSRRTWEIVVRSLSKTTRVNAITFANVQQSASGLNSLFGIPVALDDALETNESAVASA